MEPIRALIICAMGFSSSLIELNVLNEAKRRGVALVFQASGTGSIESTIEGFGPHYILLAPQATYLKSAVAQASARLGIGWSVIDFFTYATADGGKILDTILAATQPQPME
jgi:cellobiose-specific phosphotransferase system component IIB